MYKSQRTLTTRSNSVVYFWNKNQPSASKSSMIKTQEFLKGEKTGLSEFSRFAKTSCKFHCNQAKIPEIKSEPPYVVLRNGIPTYYYEPVNPFAYQSKNASSYGSQLRGSKIIERCENGNMFAVHTARTRQSPTPPASRTTLYYFRGRPKKR